MLRNSLDRRGQTSTEYLVLIAIGLLIAVIAAAGIFHVGNVVADEYNKISEYQNKVIEVLLS